MHDDGAFAAQSTVTTPTTPKRPKFLSTQISGRRIMGLVVIAILIGFVLLFGEARWLRRTDVTVEGLTTLRVLHISDIHFKGDVKYLQQVVDRINEERVDLVCHTGDLVEQARYLDAALAMLEQIRHPVYAVPGNHEHWSGVDLKRFDTALRKTRGRLLVNQSIKVAKGYSLVGIDSITAGNPNVDQAISGTEGTRLIFIFHEPLIVQLLKGRPFALALAGHSHGGQVRIPLYGAPILPSHVGEYDRGLYKTPDGPLFVSSGIGTWMINARFLCRPEIVLLHGAIR